MHAATTWPVVVGWRRHQLWQPKRRRRSPSRNNKKLQIFWAGRERNNNHLVQLFNTISVLPLCLCVSRICDGFFLQLFKIRFGKLARVKWKPWPPPLRCRLWCDAVIGRMADWIGCDGGLESQQRPPIYKWTEARCQRLVRRQRLNPKIVARAPANSVRVVPCVVPKFFWRSSNYSIPFIGFTLETLEQTKR